MRGETPVSEVAFWNTLQWITLFWYDCAAIDVAARFALLFYITLVPYFGGRFRSCRVCRGVCFLRLARFHAEQMAARSAFDACAQGVLWLSGSCRCSPYGAGSCMAI